MLRVITLTFLILGWQAQAAVSPRQGETRKAIKSKVNQYSKRLKVLTRELNTIEKKLQSHSHQYLNIEKNRSQLESSIDQLDESLGQDQLALKENLTELRQHLLRLVVSKMGKNKEAHDIVVDQILAKSLSGKIAVHKNILANIDNERKRLASFTAQIKEIAKNQEQLKEIVTALERDKNNRAQTFVQVQNDLGHYRLKLKQVAKKKRKINPGRQLAQKIGLFTAPIEHKTSLDYRKKGVTFVFRESQPVLSTRKGKIVYRGSLSKYGNVVMIDHGQETRSVLLGEFTPKVKKGAWVREGQVLGYAKPLKGGEGKVYFEVRSKDKIFETIHLLRNKTIAKN